MNKDYVGLNIPERIKIIAKESYHWEDRQWKLDDFEQGYIVDANNKDALQSAIYWAQTSKNPEPKIYEYDNGHFNITLKDAAEGSTQGGKLSFWNCILTCPDNKEFLVGINSEFLLNLLKSNTFINGKCQAKVYLGKYKGNATGVFTPNMPDYNQAIKDEQKRQSMKKATSAYKVGDVLSALTDNDKIYLGKQYRSFYTDYRHSFSSNYCDDRWDIFITYYKEPELVHVYKEVNGERIYFQNSKVKRVIKKSATEEESKELINSLKNKQPSSDINKLDKVYDVTDYLDYELSTSFEKEGLSLDDLVKKIEELIKIPFLKHSAIIIYKGTDRCKIMGNEYV